MIITILSTLLAIVFVILSGFHFYWFFGGRWGSDSVIPTKGDGNSVQEIPKLATLVVAIVLVVFGWIYLVKSGLTAFNLPLIVSKYIYWILPALFTIRAIGEFKYVGFFKTIKNTKFARSDTKFFSPLCLSMGVIGFIIVLYSQ